jgi:hypothetical protein
MKTVEIYWTDLTDEAKERLRPLYNDNDWIPIALIDLEDEVDYDLMFTEED